MACVMPTAGADFRSRLIVAGSCSISRVSVEDRRGHRRAEEQRLPLRRQILEHSADVGQEAHVEHAVGFVEHEMLDLVELRVRMLEMVEQPARRGDDDVDAGAERVLLRAHADAAEDGGAGDRRVHGELLELLEDLRGELTRRREDERARRAARSCRAAGGESAAGTRRSCRCRSCAQASTSRPSIAGGNGVGLNGRRAREAELFDASEEIAMKFERCKRGNGHKTPNEGLIFSGTLKDSRLRASARPGPCRRALEESDFAASPTR